MQLLLVRSGPAESKDAWRGEDRERPLSEEGRALVADVASALVKYRQYPDLILTSPYVRAQQTAQVVAEALGAAEKIQVNKRLAPGFGLKQLGKLLRDCEKCEVVMLVAHNPDLSELVRTLTGGRLALRKGGVAQIEILNRKELKGRMLSLLVPTAMDPLASAPAGADPHAMERDAAPR